jgi:hypothetical protein
MARFGGCKGHVALPLHFDARPICSSIFALYCESISFFSCSSSERKRVAVASCRAFSVHSSGEKSQRKSSVYSKSQLLSMGP